MIGLTIIALVALLWELFLGKFGFFNLTLRALLAIFLFVVFQFGQKYGLARRLLAVCYFVYRFFIELFAACITIAKLAFSFNPQFNPHIIAVPLNLKSDEAIALLAATITLLPGTVAMGVSEDKSILYAHAMGEADLAKAKDSVSRIEKLILGFMK